MSEGKKKLKKRDANDTLNLTDETCEETCIDGIIPRLDPQVTTLGCYQLGKGLADSFNGLALLNSPKRPGLTFADPYIEQILMDPGFCIKHCIDYKFNYAALGNGVNCRCGSFNALQSYTKVDDKASAKVCNVGCTFVTSNGNVTYQCGGKNAYSVYYAKSPNYAPPEALIEKKLDIMFDLTLNKDIHYKGCVKDSQVCGDRVLSRRCNSLDTITVDQCINFCREGNFKFAGLEAMTQCFCDNYYDGIGRLVGPEHCSASCPGNSSQICGGSWALSIYDVTPIPGSNGSNGTTTPPQPPPPPTITAPPTVSSTITITPSYDIILVAIGICIICIYRRFFNLV